MTAKKLALIAGASALAALSVPAFAQDFPLASGEYVEMTSITIDDGHNLDYANFLAGQWKAQEEFSKSQGWITGYEILANFNKRPGEPDLYLVRRFKSMPDAAEIARRDDALRAHTRKSDAQMEAGSGERAKYRHVVGSQLLQVQTIK